MTPEDEAAGNVEDREMDVTDVVEVPIGDEIDLHPFQPRDVKSVVESYLDAAYDKGLREVRIIHGRGIGVQRQIARKVLERDARVVSFRSGGPGGGGWGATVALLR